MCIGFVGTGHGGQTGAPEIETAADAYEAGVGAHCVVLCTEWDEFLNLDLERPGRIMTYRMVVDRQKCFRLDDMRAAGFAYYATGRPPIIEEVVPARSQGPSA